MRLRSCVALRSSLVPDEVTLAAFATLAILAAISEEMWTQEMAESTMQEARAQAQQALVEEELRNWWGDSVEQQPPWQKLRLARRNLTFGGFPTQLHDH